MKPANRRWLLLTVIALATLGLLALLALHSTIQPKTIVTVLSTVETATEEHLAIALILFVGSFAIFSALALPIGLIYCLAAGYLFGTSIGALASLVGAVTGALITFEAAQRLGGRKVRQRLGQSKVEPILKFLERDATFYLVIFRILPIAPFFVVNATAALSNIRTRQFNAATTLGLLPTSVIYAAAGNSFGSILDARDFMAVDLLLDPAVGLPLLGLSLLIITGFVMTRTILRDPEK